MILLSQSKFLRLWKTLRFSMLGFYIVSCLIIGDIALASEQAPNAKKLLESKTKRELNVLEFSKLADSGLYMLIVQDKTNGYKSLLLSDEKQKNLSVINAFFSDNTNAQKQVEAALQAISLDNFKTQNAAKFRALFNAIPKDYAITILGSGKTPKKLYIISDPMCSHCQDELARIESKLQTHTIVMIPVGLLGQDSLYKAAEIYEKSAQAKTPKEQIELLRSIYSNAHKAQKPIDAAYAKTISVTNTIKNSNLIEGVPFLYELD